MKQAACVLITNPAGQIVLTTRPDSTTVGLPGGKVEVGETAAQAAVREVYEETGIVLDIKDIEPVYEGVCLGEVNYNTTTFKTRKPIDTIPGGIETHIASRWGYHDELLTNSPFVEYNKQVLQRI